MNFNMLNSQKDIGQLADCELQVETTKLNYTNTVDKLKQKLQLWKNRKLSIIGKTTIIKTIAIPQLIYLLTVLPTPDASILDSIDKTLTEFLWNSKTNHIK